LHEYVAYAAVFIACLARTTMPYWNKKRQNKILEFNNNYFGTFLSALILSGVIASLLFPQIKLPDTNVSNVLGFCLLFTQAWGMNDIINTLLLDLRK